MDAERSRDLDISLRLKAARFLAGYAGYRGNSKDDKPVGVALDLEDLARRPPLPENRITANKLAEIERMVTYATPGQVTAISAALGIDLMALPMVAPDPAAIERFAAARVERELGAAAQAARTAQGRAAQGTGARGPQRQGKAADGE